MQNLPYSSEFFPLLNAIHKALVYCYGKYRDKEDLSFEDEVLARYFEEALEIKSYQTTGLDQHIIKGLFDIKTRVRHNVYPRLSKLVVHAFLRAQESKASEKNYRGIIIPSPLSILYHALTIPEEPQTASYAFVTCRGMLFDMLGLHPETPELRKISKNLDPFSEEDILQSLISFRNHTKIQLRWPGGRLKTEGFAARLNFLTGHILSIKRYSYLWFRSEASLINFLGYSLGNLNEKYSGHKMRSAYRNQYEQELKYNFRKSGYYHDLPDASEVNNWVFGIPIPWRGADLLFFGGLKKMSQGGIIMSLYGAPGVGKTSAALSLAANMAPFGTQTIYISLEEHPKDLKTRLRSLIPEFLRRTSIFNEFDKYKKGDTEIPWFQAFRYGQRTTIPKAINILKILKEKIDQSQKEKLSRIQGNLIPATCPLLIVLDNINELFDHKSDYQDTEEFIEYCRSIGAFVVLVSGDEISKQQKLDYLVDVAIRLTQNGIDNKLEKPVRVLQLLKTRHQVSRQGSHVFHLSSSTGFRISPQVPSQMDKREKIKVKLPSTKEFIHTLNLVSQGKKLVVKDIIPVAINSQILVHGHGSSGKAGFGLKLLLTPVAPHDLPILVKKSKLPIKSTPRKVLIISFLYPKEYYDVLKKRITDQYRDNIDHYDPVKNKVVVKAFYPGFLTPEDFVNKVVRLLEEARLEGEPFTGVMLDGLHNVFLQFKYLQEAHMIWPLLYSILYRYSVTVVTTFTNFSLDDLTSTESDIHRSFIDQDSLLMQQGQKPFLHGLVKAADYFFVLDTMRSNDQSKKEHLLSIRSSIRQTPPTSHLIWDREKLTLKLKD